MSKPQKLSTGKNYTVGVGILSWRAHQTLEKSLQSYAKIGFKEFFDEFKIIFQEVSDQDIALAKKYGIDYIGLPENVGIQEGQRQINENIQTDYVLILENDNPVIEDAETSFMRLSQALDHLEQNNLDIMRLRHRWNFGEAFCIFKYSRYHPIRELHESFCHPKQIINDPLTIKWLRRTFRPFKKIRICGRAVYFEKNPHKIFPKYIKKLDKELFSVDSKVLFWTNQCVLLNRDVHRKILDYADAHPTKRTTVGFQYLEANMDCSWWKQQHFKIGVGTGIFTHARFDDSWREEHWAFNTETTK